MRLILLGPPGSGKGTQAKLLAERLGLTHVGTGDLLRQAIHLETRAGVVAKPYLDSGRLVPDEIVNDLIADCLRRPDRPERFVMDGYPRTLAQAKAFDGVLRQCGLCLHGSVHLVVADEEVVSRLGGRRTCPRCGAVYHVRTRPSRKENICDKDGVTLTQRPDDREDTIRARLRIYHQNTDDLVAHYRSLGLLREVAGKGSVEEIYSQVLHVLTRRAPPPCSDNSSPNPRN